MALQSCNKTIELELFENELIRIRDLISRLKNKEDVLEKITGASQYIKIIDKCFLDGAGDRGYVESEENETFNDVSEGGRITIHNVEDEKLCKKTRECYRTSDKKVYRLVEEAKRKLLVVKLERISFPVHVTSEDDGMIDSVVQKENKVVIESPELSNIPETEIMLVQTDQHNAGKEEASEKSEEANQTLIENSSDIEVMKLRQLAKEADQKPPAIKTILTPVHATSKDVDSIVQKEKEVVIESPELSNIPETEIMLVQTDQHNAGKEEASEKSEEANQTLIENSSDIEVMELRQLAKEADQKLPDVKYQKQANLERIGDKLRVRKSKQKKSKFLHPVTESKQEFHFYNSLEVDAVDLKNKNFEVLNILFHLDDSLLELMQKFNQNVSVNFQLNSIFQFQALFLICLCKEYSKRRRIVFLTCRCATADDEISNLKKCYESIQTVHSWVLKRELTLKVVLEVVQESCCKLMDLYSVFTLLINSNNRIDYLDIKHLRQFLKKHQSCNTCLEAVQVFRSKLYTWYFEYCLRTKNAEDFYLSVDQLMNLGSASDHHFACFYLYKYFQGCMEFDKRITKTEYGIDALNIIRAHISGNYIFIFKYRKNSIKVYLNLVIDLFIYSMVKKFLEITKKASFCQKISSNNEYINIAIDCLTDKDKLKILEIFHLT